MADFSVRVRFAPSPTGLLHVGNARIALVNWLFARAHGGAFVLRLDDTDKERCRPHFAEAIERDLTWLGLGWDSFAKQSARMEAYQAAFTHLTQSGRLYPCYETAEELEYKRKRQLKRGEPPTYDRAALKLSDAERRTLVTEGRRAHWRFRLNHEPIAWEDLVRGPVHFEGQNLSDPVLVREDGTFLYMMPSAIDDIDLAISHVIRGEDHVANTAMQIQIFQAMEAAVPAFAHLPLLTDASGAGLSKRLGSLGLESLRDDGIEPMAINSLLARLGTPDPIEPKVELAELVEGFDIGRFGRASPKFDPTELKGLNARLLHTLPYAKVKDRLVALGLGHADERFWNAVRANIAALAEAGLWHGVCFSTLTPVIQDRDFVRKAAALLPPEPWDESTWSQWTEALQKATGRRGKELFMPLRLVLTGREHGPELKSLLPLIGRGRALARLFGEAA